MHTQSFLSTKSIISNAIYLIYDTNSSAFNANSIVLNTKFIVSNAEFIDLNAEFIDLNAYRYLGVRGADLPEHRPNAQRHRLFLPRRRNPIVTEGSHIPQHDIDIRSRQGLPTADG